MIEILKTFLYGLISGLSEILPISSRGHQSVLMQMFGMSHRDPVLDLMTHIGILASVFFLCREDLLHFKTAFSIRPRRTNRSASPGYYDVRLLRSAIIPLIISLFFYGTGRELESKPLAVALFFVMNGIIVFVTDYIRQSNKSAGQMGFLDSLLLGLSGVACIFPGISRIGLGTSLMILRGADKQNAFKWLLLLTVPTMVFMILFDIVSMFTLGLTSITIWLFIGYILTLAAAFCGGYIGITFMRFLSVNSGFSAFAFYSWGGAVFTFILYLIAY